MVFFYPFITYLSVEDYSIFVSESDFFGLFLFLQCSWICTESFFIRHFFLFFTKLRLVEATLENACDIMHTDISSIPLVFLFLDLLFQFTFLVFMFVEMVLISSLAFVLIFMYFWFNSHFVNDSHLKSSHRYIWRITSSNKEIVNYYLHSFVVLNFGFLSVSDFFFRICMYKRSWLRDLLHLESD